MSEVQFNENIFQLESQKIIYIKNTTWILTKKENFYFTISFFLHLKQNFLSALVSFFLSFCYQKPFKKKTTCIYKTYISRWKNEKETERQTGFQLKTKTQQNKIYHII